MRQTEYRRRSRALNAEIEAEIRKASQVELNWLFRQVQYKIRRINQFRPRIGAPRPKLQKAFLVSGDLWEMFSRRMHSRLMKELIIGAIRLADLNRERYRYLSIEPIEFSSEDFARRIGPDLGKRIVGVSNRIKRYVGRKTVTWYNSPGTTMQSIVDKLQRHFGESRARLIAQTEITYLNSAVIELTAEQVGAEEWWWSTRNDNVVCTRDLIGPDGKTYKGCRGLHGKRFKVGMKMPPAHPGCRCDAILILRVSKADGLQKADFKEEEHPRDDSGKWTDKGGAGKKPEKQKRTPKEPAQRKVYTRTVKTAGKISGNIPQRDGKPVPIKTKRMFHVTRRENLDSILEGGFDLKHVKPRWVNDYAISLTNSTLTNAMGYFTQNIKGATFDTEKYAVVEVTVKGRLYEEYDGVNYHVREARDWTRQAVADGWDGQMGRNVFIYNPKSIADIREVDPDKMAASNKKLSSRIIKLTESTSLRKADFNEPRWVKVTKSLKKATWDESKHPRRGKGAQGGQFAPKGQGGGGEVPDKAKTAQRAPKQPLEVMYAAPNPAVDNLPEVKKWRKTHLDPEVYY